MFAECCGTLVVPDKRPNVARWCDCRCAAVWWTNPNTGELSVHTHFVSKDVMALTGSRAVSVLGLHNGLLFAKFRRLESGREYGIVQKEVCDELVSQADGYLFKTIGQLVVRFRPDFHGVAGVTFVPDIEKVPAEAPSS